MIQKFCPKCGHEVPKERRYLRNWMWAKWNCSNCETVLGFCYKRRSLMIFLDAIILVLVWIAKVRWEVDLRWWFYAWLLLTTLLVVPLIDGIRVVAKSTD